MTYEVGQVLKGKVTGIQPYGAFIALEENTQGLVHISEIAHGYVKNIDEFVKIGDEVEVKVLTVEDNGKLSLSIKATQEAPAQVERAPRKPRPKKQVKQPIVEENGQGFNTLKDKLQDWIEQSKREDLVRK
ncbi:general stress protein 13 [Bacillus sp. HMF5848]|uniref:S1 domain-containing post-transcriptional regulator GSP13 n=1 Tax=Bacillus sp. HMF5848 TaxID=2495421 RepID=UPI000F780F74|nr:S1 domain-containing post-transcriptional regulator GSP13 [Bacillus sp. HMF5848]RSK28393.1 general stress protein 13 [Bacillus sp. HMF5848]